MEKSTDLETVRDLHKSNQEIIFQVGFSQNQIKSITLNQFYSVKFWDVWDLLRRIIKKSLLNRWIKSSII